jgi:hypothetical protein
MSFELPHFQPAVPRRETAGFSFLARKQRAEWICFTLAGGNFR